MTHSETAELAQLIRIGWILLIPVGVLLSLVLYKLAMLLHELLGFLTIARYELAPAIKDLRLTAEHVEVLSSKAVSSVQTMEDGAAVARTGLQAAGRELKAGAKSLWGGIRESFARKK